MKVTDEMITRAIEAMEVREPKDLRTAIDDVLRRKYVRVALEAALADIPDPEQVRAEIMDELAYGRSVERQALDARIAELEAKVARVRAWAKAGVNRRWSDLLGVLDGKEQP